MTTINDVCGSFEGLKGRIEQSWLPYIDIKNTFLQTHGWQQPALTPEDASLLCTDISKRLRTHYDDADQEANTYWREMAAQADLIKFSNFSSDPSGVARSTFDFLLVCFVNLPSTPLQVDWESVKTKNYIPRELARRINSMEQRLADLEPRAETIQQKVTTIEAAHDAANQLPTDLAELRNGSTELRGLLTEAAKNKGQIERDVVVVEETRSKIEKLGAEADAIVQKCQENYRITTSAGLAGAFDERSKALNTTAWAWVAMLVSSLLFAVWLGTSRLDSFKTLLTEKATPSIIVLNLLIAVLGVAGPVWIAWIASKNIGQNFKLAEDYAFKASVSKAYEGYRKEAVNLDMEFARKLFDSALNRLDEAPSRFIAERDHNSPLEAVLDSPVMKAIFESIPELKDNLLKHTESAATTLTRVGSRKPALGAKSRGPQEDVEGSK